MKKLIDDNFGEQIVRKNSLMWVWENQHPVMYWWFAATSICFCSMYVILLTKF